ncbi:hypothetical protein ACFOWE_22060 [Planomonospora corallina]|uniref:MFS transporter n=1 Tax=Planomonospora corallina TaxID=1806052 RepID=A0ABV8IA06_9ACTN
MAVPPTQPARTVTAESAVPTHAPRSSALLDVVLGLLVAVALPLAIVAIPNTISVVAALLPPGVSQVEMIRAHGLALPSMVVTVPLAAILVRRMRPAPLLMGGLTLLALADAAGGYADSALVVGILRGAHGIGAGLLIPATLVAVWERPRVLRAVWAGMLATSLLAAQALALWPLDEATSWRVTLQPYPLLTGIALVLAACHLVLSLRSGESGTASSEQGTAERGRLLMAAVPSVGVALLAVGVTFDWSAGLVVLTALLAVVALLGLASAGAAEGTGGRTLAYTMVAVGAVILPTAAQVTYVELGGLGGPGLSGLWPAFVLAGIGALAAAVLVNRMDGAAVPMTTAAGLVAVVIGLCSVRFLLPSPDGPVLIAPFVLLAAGAAVALTSALRLSGVGSSLFALALFFPAVLGGFLLGSGIQVSRLKEATSSQGLVDGFVRALHLWALFGGGLVVVVIVLCALLARRAAAATGSGRAAANGTDANGTDAKGAGGSSAEGDGAEGRDTRPGEGVGADPTRGAGGGSGTDTLPRVSSGAGPAGAPVSTEQAATERTTAERISPPAAVERAAEETEDPKGTEDPERVPGRGAGAGPRDGGGRRLPDGSRPPAEETGPGPVVPPPMPSPEDADGPGGH